MGRMRRYLAYGLGLAALLYLSKILFAVAVAALVILRLRRKGSRDSGGLSINLASRLYQVDSLVPRRLVFDVYEADGKRYLVNLDTFKVSVAKSVKVRLNDLDSAKRLLEETHRAANILGLDAYMVIDLRNPYEVNIVTKKERSALKVTKEVLTRLIGEVDENCSILASLAAIRSGAPITEVAPEELVRKVM